MITLNFLSKLFCRFRATGVSNLETCMDYFAPPVKSCENLNFSAHMSKMMHRGEKLASSQKICLGRLS